jgi:hypothetical protein
MKAIKTPRSGLTSGAIGGSATGAGDGGTAVMGKNQLHRATLQGAASSSPEGEDLDCTYLLSRSASFSISPNGGGMDMILFDMRQGRLIAAG